MSLLLENTITDLLQIDFIVIGIVLASFGLAISLLAKRIAKMVRKSAEIAPTDSVMLTFKAFGLVCVVVALVLMIIMLN